MSGGCPPPLRMPTITDLNPNRLEGNTGIMCPPCGQQITRDADGVTECGGIGEGGCAHLFDGDPAAVAAHDRAATA